MEFMFNPANRGQWLLRPAPFAPSAPPENPHPLSNPLDRRGREYQGQLNALEAQLNIYRHRETNFQSRKKLSLWIGVGFVLIAVVGAGAKLGIHDQRDKLSSASYSPPSFHEAPIAVVGKDIAYASLIVASCCFLFALASHFLAARASRRSLELSNEFAAQQIQLSSV